MSVSSNKWNSYHFVEVLRKVIKTSIWNRVFLDLKFEKDSRKNGDSLSIKH